MAVSKGFTLIELMIVVAIIAIIAAIALPAYATFTIRAQVGECSSLTTATKLAVGSWYMERGSFPLNQAQLGQTDLPSGNYVDQLEVVNGALQCRFGNKAHSELTGRLLTIRPAPNGNGDVAWVCGSSTVPAGHTAVGTDATTVQAKYLPPFCK